MKKYVKFKGKGWTCKGSDWEKEVEAKALCGCSGFGYNACVCGVFVNGKRLL